MPFESPLQVGAVTVSVATGLTVGVTVIVFETAIQP